VRPARPPVAFYAPLKSPDHDTPSGDRTMARLLMAALERTGTAPFLASPFRSLVKEPNPSVFADMADRGAAEAGRVIQALATRPKAERPQAWFTYHNYYKAPDHLGPRVAAALDIPYIIAEPSRSPKRLKDAWADYAAYAESGIDLADIVFVLTERDRPAVETKLSAFQELAMLRPFIDPGPVPPLSRAVPPDAPWQLLTTAMMRPGDKLASYQALAESLGSPVLGDLDWRLSIIGDGAERAAVEAVFAPFGERIRYLGRIDDPARLRQHYEAADLFVWPGINEAFGMVYLEAQAAGLPAVAEDRPGVRSVVRVGRLSPADDRQAFAEAIRRECSRDNLEASRRAARRIVEQDHSIDGAAALLHRHLVRYLDLPAMNMLEK
ncbi:MAG: glycosyltransferase family 4 protein, partial [Pseudomonadota bacterium]